MAKSGELRDLRKERDSSRAEYEREIERALCKCSHKKDNDKLALKVVDLEARVFECKLCGIEFSSRTYSDREIQDAYNVIHDVIHQTKCIMPNKRDGRNDPAVTILGQLDADNRMVIKMNKDFKFQAEKKGSKNKYSDDIEKFGFENHYSQY